MSKYDFECQNRIFRLIANVKMGILMSKQGKPTQCECQNRIRHSNWVGISYFDIQNSILTFAISQKIVLWHSKSYFDIGPESGNPILTFKSYFDIRYESENPILTFKIVFWHLSWVWKSYFDSQILFWHSIWVGKSYSDIQNPILTFKILVWHSHFWLFRLIASVKIGIWMSKQEFPTPCECQNRIQHSNWVGKSNFNIQNPILTFAMSQNFFLTFQILFWHLPWCWKSYFDHRYESENPILALKILFWHSHFWHFRLESDWQNRILKIKIGFSDS